MSKWLYFGCHVGAGHYLFEQGMLRSHGSGLLCNFDGLLAPQDSRLPYIAAVSRLEGWGMTALSFWDYSVDKRRGSNSIIFVPSLTISPDDLLSEARQRFPQVFARLPAAVTLKQSAEGCSLQSQNEVRHD